ncbi:MAG: S8 family serine peptidase, partial [Lachnospira sp.]|nr:S8 family serine peptidase [Lachnospira sp.]
VGANGRAPGSAATFSGRGVNVKSGLLLYAKPDITAPGVNIRIPGNKEKTVTGTSFATPMVTGAAAMLMEWGIVKGNDQYMYGEKLKAYLINGATRVGNVWPDSARGWGELCVAASIPAK